MKEIRTAESRGNANHGWLRSRHSFSFAHYHSPERVSWGPLRVINDDQVAEGAGFPAHSHRDMEIFSYVTKGSLAHEDSLGNRETLTPGRIQLMSAGTGIQHSEFNASEIEPVHFLQIWIQPDQIGLPPSYQDLTIEPESMTNRWKTIIEPIANPGQQNALKIHQDASVMVAKLEEGKSLEVPPTTGRKGYLHIIDGEVELDSEKLGKGDAIAIEDEAAFPITAREQSEVIFFDL